MGLNKSKLRIYKHDFDKITSENSKNWQLLIFWIIVFEIMSSILEFIFFASSASFVPRISSAVVNEIIIGVFISLFVWSCIYNLVHWNKRDFFVLILVGLIDLYLLITKDLTFEFLVHNMEPLHFFQTEMSIALMVVIFIKLIMTYLFYQLYVSLRNIRN